VTDGETLRSLAERHVVVLDPETDRILMAHPFAAAPAGDALVDADGRTWFGNCAWDALGIVAALGLESATVRNNGVTVRVDRGRVADDGVFHVAVPARSWWDDIAFT
jgi:hypothetical protein